MIHGRLLEVQMKQVACLRIVDSEGPIEWRHRTVNWARATLAPRRSQFTAEKNISGPCLHRTQSGLGDRFRQYASLHFLGEISHETVSKYLSHNQTLKFAPYLSALDTALRGFSMTMLSGKHERGFHCETSAFWTDPVPAQTWSIHSTTHFAVQSTHSLPLSSYVEAGRPFDFFQLPS